LGGTIYETMDTEIAFSGPWFIPRSRLAEWRREVLTMLEEQQTLPLTPSQERGVVTTDLCPHQQNIILPSLVEGLGEGPLGVDSFPFFVLIRLCRICFQYCFAFDFNPYGH
jgi:hypothetical protein